MPTLSVMGFTSISLLALGLGAMMLAVNAWVLGNLVKRRQFELNRVADPNFVQSVSRMFFCGLAMMATGVMFGVVVIAIEDLLAFTSGPT